MKYEWKKEEKRLYGVKQKPEIINIPSQKFITINGEGNPNEIDFSDRISALFNLAYGIKMLFKKMYADINKISFTDFTVFPLEGIWRKNSGEKFDKSKLKYTIMIKQPDFITQDIFENALENVKKKKLNVLYNEINFEEIEDGKSVQILHIGSYDDEWKSFEMMDKLANELNLIRTGDFHREIYLSNKNRTSEDKQKTILRYSVR